MDPILLALGIQATLRAAQAGADLYGEHARTRKIFLPNLELPPGTRPVQLAGFLAENPQLAAGNRDFSGIWDAESRELITTQAEAIDEAYARMLEHRAKLQLIGDGREENSARHEAQMLAAGRMIEQWREERKPPSALIRMGLTLADIGLEFVAAHPSLLGAGSRGETLIAAFATRLSLLLPNDTAAFGPKADFADRVLGIFLRAGLGTLSDHSSLVFRDADIARLLSGVTKPIVDSLPETVAEQYDYRKLVDALAGPAAAAAFRMLAENPESCLGKNFADDKALGAVTTALFEQIQVSSQGGNIVEAFGEPGLIRLYQAALGVAVERPELFAGEDNSAKVTLLRELLGGAAATLKAHPDFEGPLGVSLAAMALETVGRNAPALARLNPDEPWEKVALTALRQMAAGLSGALRATAADGAHKGALKSFSRAQLLELGRVVLTQVAETPGMLGIRRTEVQAILAGIAAAMAADGNLLLSPEEWTTIAGIAARQAAANPGRLFGLSLDDPREALAGQVIQSGLEVAEEAWATGGRANGSVLFGKTLEAALAATLESLAGDVAAVAANADLPGLLLRSILDQAAAHPENFGSAGVLEAFRTFIGPVMAQGRIPAAGRIAETLSV